MPNCWASTQARIQSRKKNFVVVIVDDFLFLAAAAAAAAYYTTIQLLLARWFGRRCCWCWSSRIEQQEKKKKQLGLRSRNPKWARVRKEGKTSNAYNIDKCIYIYIYERLCSVGFIGLLLVVLVQCCRVTRALELRVYVEREIGLRKVGSYVQRYNRGRKKKWKEKGKNKNSGHHPFIAIASQPVFTSYTQWIR